MTYDANQRSERILIALSFACFLVLGMAAGLLGVAWPSMRADFQLPLDAISGVLITSTIGFVIGSVIAGNWIARRGLIQFLTLATAFAAAGLIGYALAPSWWWFVVFGLLAGFGSGGIDTGLNIYVAGSQNVRTMNWMHACFGIGAAAGPLLMTAAVTTGLGWRYGYALTGMIALVLLLVFFLLSRQGFAARERSVQEEIGEARRESILDAAAPRETVRLLAVWLAVLLFFLYTGVESTAGQWTFTLFTESRGVTAAAAGVLTSVFWAMLTLGRVVFGAAAQRIGIDRMLRLSMVGTLAMALLVVTQNTWAGFVGIAGMGLALSAIFPTLTAETPHRVGIRHAANTIGYQTGGASIGFAVLPGLAGTLAARSGLEVIGWILVISSALMLVTNEIAIIVAHRDARRRKAEREAAALQ